MGVAYSCYNFYDLPNDDGNGICKFCNELTDEDLSENKMKHYIAASKNNNEEFEFVNENEIKYICRKRQMIYDKKTKTIN